MQHSLTRQECDEQNTVDGSATSISPVPHDENPAHTGACSQHSAFVAPTKLAGLTFKR